MALRKRSVEQLFTVDFYFRDRWKPCRVD